MPCASLWLTCVDAVVDARIARACRRQDHLGRRFGATPSCRACSSRGQCDCSRLALVFASRNMLRCRTTTRLWQATRRLTSAPPVDENVSRSNVLDPRRPRCNRTSHRASITARLAISEPPQNAAAGSGMPAPRPGRRRGGVPVQRVRGQGAVRHRMRPAV